MLENERVRLQKEKPIENPIEKPHAAGYEMYGEKKDIVDKGYEEFKNKCISKLKSEGVNVDKVSFARTPTFTYDMETRDINPEYRVMLPMMSDGRFDISREAKEIDADKKGQIRIVSVDTHEGYDYKTWVYKINNSDRGVVFYIDSDAKSVDIMTKKEVKVVFGVDTDRVRIKFLDEVA